jgi:hypothetical protein
VDRNTPDYLVRGDVDHVDDRGLPLDLFEAGARNRGRNHGDRRVDLPVLLVDHDLVGPLRERDLLDLLERLVSNTSIVLSCSFAQ